MMKKSSETSTQKSSHSCEALKEAGWITLFQEYHMQDFPLQTDLLTLSSMSSAVLFFY